MEHAFKVINDIFLLKNPKVYSSEDLERIITALSFSDHFKFMQQEKDFFQEMQEFAQNLTFRHVSASELVYFYHSHDTNIYFIVNGAIGIYTKKSEQDIETENFWRLQLLNQNQQQTSSLLAMQSDLSSPLKPINRIDVNSFHLEHLSQQPTTNQTQAMKTPRGGGGGNEDSVQPDQKQPTTQTQTPLAATQPTNVPLDHQQQMQQKIFQQSIPLRRGATTKLKVQMKSYREEIREVFNFYRNARDEEVLKRSAQFRKQFFQNDICLFKKVKQLDVGKCFGKQTEFDENCMPFAMEDTNLLFISQDLYRKTLRNFLKKRAAICSAVAQELNLPESEKLVELAHQFTEATYPDQSLVYNEGTCAVTHFYLIKSGIVEVRKSVKRHFSLSVFEDEVLLEEKQPGQFFGHVEAILRRRRMTKALAIGTVVLYEITVENFKKFCYYQMLEQMINCCALRLQKWLEMLKADELRYSGQLLLSNASIKSSKSVQKLIKQQQASLQSDQPQLQQQQQQRHHHTLVADTDLYNKYLTMSDDYFAKQFASDKAIKNAMFSQSPNMSSRGEGNSGGFSPKGQGGSRQNIPLLDKEEDYFQQDSIMKGSSRLISTTAKPYRKVGQVSFAGIHDATLAKSPHGKGKAEYFLRDYGTVIKGGNLQSERKLKANSMEHQLHQQLQQWNKGTASQSPNAAGNKGKNNLFITNNYLINQQSVTQQQLNIKTKLLPTSKFTKSPEAFALSSASKSQGFFENNPSLGVGGTGTVLPDAQVQFGNKIQMRSLKSDRQPSNKRGREDSPGRFQKLMIEKGYSNTSGVAEFGTSVKAKNIGFGENPNPSRQLGDEYQSSSPQKQLSSVTNNSYMKKNQSVPNLNLTKVKNNDK